MDLKDAFAFGGLIILGAGLWLIYPPSALITAGLFFMWLGVGK